MAWDANEKGNPAWLTKQASEHGGVDNFIDDIHNEGYQEGHERGMIVGAGVATVVITVVIGAYEGIKYLVQKHKVKKQVVIERSDSAQNAIRQMCEDTDDKQYDDNDVSDLDD
ncbi:MAG: hypothetical protein IKW96_03905 [Ruminococcus sp.]|uniref:hypothetical protein n=1 Tax=Ruminococcus sp. TaxID=41978 RepID=UPI0025D46C52|nr:hypothetical protein [Ruminococcus sp.]MBR5682414.1 hypothetical protein [Ruminococcus sp.]